jgi:pimeloyl-ACP methyl ester carboxylesterase
VNVEVTFFQDDGVQLEGDLVIPGRDPVGAVAMCAGFRGTRRGGSSMAVAEALAEGLGWAVLLFDYAGFGGSAGVRGRFDPEQEVLDIRAAASYLLQRFPGRPVSLYGNSFGAGMATAAFGRDSRVASLYSLCAFSSGAALMADGRPHWQLVELNEALENDRLARAAGGTSREVDPDWIMVRDPEAAAYIARLASAGKADRTPMHVADADRLAAFRPIADAHRLRGRPTRFAHCERDFFVPAWHSRALAEAAKGELVVFKGYGHYAIYEGEPQQVLIRDALDFYRRVVPA